MMIIHRYLFRQLFVSMVYVLLSTVGILTIFTIIAEISALKNEYGFIESLYFTITFTIGSLFTYFPFVALISVLIVAGRMTETNELMVLRASGYSIVNICLLILCIVFIFSSILIIAENYVLSPLRQHASIYKSSHKYPGSLNRSFQFWISEGNTITNYLSSAQDNGIKQILIYEFDDNQQLNTVTSNNSNLINNQQTPLEEAKGTIIEDGLIYKNTQPRVDFSPNYHTHFLMLESYDPTHLSLTELYSLTKYKADKNQDNPYLVIFLQKIFSPLNICALTFFALSFVFGYNRAVGTGTRVFVGIFVGLIFNIMAEFSVPIYIIFLWPGLIMTLLPSILAIGIGAIIIRRKASF